MIRPQLQSVRWWCYQMLAAAIPSYPMLQTVHAADQRPLRDASLTQTLPSFSSYGMQGIDPLEAEILNRDRDRDGYAQSLGQ